jgi:hypothetical protein
MGMTPVKVKFACFMRLLDAIGNKKVKTFNTDLETIPKGLTSEMSTW